MTRKPEDSGDNLENRVKIIVDSDADEIIEMAV
jgi:hypothetical protein